MITPFNFEDTQRQLDMLGAPNRLFDFVTIPKSGGVRHYCGSFEQYRDALLHHNSQGDGIFITVNETDANGRKKENITRVTALFVDFDIPNTELPKMLAQLPLPPSMIICSSQHKYHAYWVIGNGAIELNHFTELQKRLIASFAEYGADKSIHDLPRIMRLAGFYHLKGEPYLTHIVHIGERYDSVQLIDFVNSLPVVGEPASNQPKTKQNTPVIAHGCEHGTVLNTPAAMVRQRAKGHWQRIFAHYALAVSTNPNSHTACPYCGGVDRFRFENHEGEGNFYCSQGGEGLAAGDGFSFLADHCGLGVSKTIQMVNDALDILLSTNAKSSPSTILLKSFEDIEAIKIRWLWRDWLPLGKLVVLGGDAGCGKTTLTLKLIAALTTGGYLPDGSQCEIGSALIWSSEDDPADTLKPRLMAAGANVSKVHMIQGKRGPNGLPLPFDPATDMRDLEQTAQSIPDLKLLMIDPIVSAVSKDMHKANDVRAALQPIVDFAAHTDCCVIGITHFSKGSTGSTVQHRIIGSQAFAAVARMVLVASRREVDGDVVLMRAKSNVSETDGGFLYEFEKVALQGEIEASQVVWTGPIEGTAREILNEAETFETELISKTEEAVSFLALLLTGKEAVPEPLIRAQASQRGISKRTLDRAKKPVGVISKKIGPSWYWEIPNYKN